MEPVNYTIHGESTWSLFPLEELMVNDDDHDLITFGRNGTPGPHFQFSDLLQPYGKR